jgi:homocysteine S-methyltransferase
MLNQVLKDKEYLVLDGGLATTLELNGYILDRKLWSAWNVVSNPLSVIGVHTQFIDAGCDIITTSSYQMSFEGFHEKGFSREQAIMFLRRSTACGVAAREMMKFKKSSMVAASIGCYGAHLGDGSEYIGRYGKSVDELVEWHERKYTILVGSGVDLVACETVPCVAECQALIKVTSRYAQGFNSLSCTDAASPNLSGWISCACNSQTTLNSGEPFEDALRVMSDVPHELQCPVVSTWGLGINCSNPEYISGLLDVIHDVGLKNRPIVVYPNRGESRLCVTLDYTYSLL